MNRGRTGFRHTANAVVVPAVGAGRDVAPTRCAEERTEPPASSSDRSRRGDVDRRVCGALAACERRTPGCFQAIERSGRCRR